MIAAVNSEHFDLPPRSPVLTCKSHHIMLSHIQWTPSLQPYLALTDSLENGRLDDVGLLLHGQVSEHHDSTE